MAITGGIKFFDKSRCLLKDGATAEVTSGDMVSDYLLDSNPITSWNSVDSNDTTTENIDIRFTEREFDRIFIVDHNLKQYTIQYWNGSAFVNFSSVVGIGGSLGSISETTFAQDTSYYEFTPVTASLIRIAALKTQVANDEKFISQVIVTTELGTLQGYPKIQGLKLSKNSSEGKMLSGKMNIIKGYESFGCTLKFDNYPASLSDDLDLAMTLYDRQEPFLMWLCGGRYLSTHFPYPLRGFRLKDVHQCQTLTEASAEYYKNIYNAPVDIQLKIVEHV